MLSAPDWKCGVFFSIGTDKVFCDGALTRERAVRELLLAFADKRVSLSLRISDAFLPCASTATFANVSCCSTGYAYGGFTYSANLRGAFAKLLICLSSSEDMSCKNTSVQSLTVSGALQALVMMMKATGVELQPVLTSQPHNTLLNSTRIYIPSINATFRYVNTQASSAAWTHGSCR